MLYVFVGATQRLRKARIACRVPNGQDSKVWDLRMVQDRCVEVKT